MSKNCIVAQSGGPTAAINASLAGVVAAARDLEYMIKFMVRFTEFRAC